MKVLYIAPRYHTNQVPVVEGWLKNGHEVMFISQVTNAGENHQVLEPVVLGYSSVYLWFYQIYNRIKKQKLDNQIFATRSKYGFPSYGQLKKLIKEYAPDVAILRERSIYSMVAYIICKKLKIPSILYNQSPYWEVPNRKRAMLKRMAQEFFPRVRMTPVYGFPGEDKCCERGTYYIPFVMEPNLEGQEKEHFREGRIQIVCVGAYYEIKCMPLLLEAIARLKDKYPLHLTIIGEVINKEETEYFHYIEGYVEKLDMKDNVTLYQNFKRAQVFEHHKKSDLFVLASAKERASISQLEAMACGLPVICSDTNGSCFQIENGVNGFVFIHDDVADLTDKIEKAICDKEKLSKMGENSYKLVCEKYSFQSYYDGIRQIVKDMKKGK